MTEFLETILILKKEEKEVKTSEVSRKGVKVSIKIFKAYIQLRKYNCETIESLCSEEKIDSEATKKLYLW